MSEARSGMAANHMKQNTTLPVYAAEPVHYGLKELLVAYDFSAAADSSLKYAVMLSKRFGSVIHLIGVQSPAEYASALESGPLAVEVSQRDLQFGLEEIEKRLRAEGISCDSVRRIGNVSDTIEGAVLEHTPDLLFLGAYGYGPIDRSRLGSTAEHLLRTVRCPAFVVGPNALLRDREAAPIKRILCPSSSLDIADSIFCFAGHLAGQTGAHLELAYVVDPAQKDVRPRRRCEEWTTELRERGVKVTWTVLYGRAGTMLAQHAFELKASLILFALHRSGNQMIDCPDGVVSATILQAPCPVMTVPPVLIDTR